MDIFYGRIKEVLKGAGFWKTWLYSFLWNLQSKKFQAFIVAIIFFYFRYIDQGTFLIVIGIYVGSNIVEKINWNIKGLGGKNVELD